MSQPFPVRPPSPVALDDRTRDNIRFIRETMERAGSFTAVPGWGGVALGITALGAATIASRMSPPRDWLLIWLCELALAVAIAGWTTLSKARRSGTSLLTGPARRFAYSFAPPILAGAHDCRDGSARGRGRSLEMAAALRNCCLSRRVRFDRCGFRSMGLCFVVLGGSSLCPDWGNAFLAAGFGLLHILFGAVIARNYG